MQLRSSAFDDGARIPAQYTCEGDDISPPLSWTGAPPETKSFALVCEDPDAPAGTWFHWAIYDIAANVSELAEHYPTDARVGAVRQAINSFKLSGYGGPCPPPGHGTHHYRFRLFALDRDVLSLGEGADCRAVAKAAAACALAEVTLVGIYSR